MANKKSMGKRKKTRSLFRRSGSRLTISKLIRQFKAGQKVQINIDSAVHSAMPAPRFQGITGTVIGKIGQVYNVGIKDGGLSKFLVVHPAHLKVIKETQPTNQAESKELVSASNNAQMLQLKKGR